MAPPSWIPNIPQADHDPLHDPALFADDTNSDSSEDDDSDSDDDNDHNSGNLFNGAPPFPPSTFNGLLAPPSSLPTSN